MRSATHVAAVIPVIILCFYYVGLLDRQRLAEGVPSILMLMRESFPPDFGNALSWAKPLMDTLAMSVAGTAIAVFMSLPLAFLSARNTAPHVAVYQLARGLLNGLRSVPELIMGILFVAAVGFGALPGVWPWVFTRWGWWESSLPKLLSMWRTNQLRRLKPLEPAPCR